MQGNHNPFCINGNGDLLIIISESLLVGWLVGLINNQGDLSSCGLKNDEYVEKFQSTGMVINFNCVGALLFHDWLMIKVLNFCLSY